MKSNAPPNNHHNNDFVLQKVGEHCYIHHLPTQTVFYVHYESNSYPDNIDENRYHHPVGAHSDPKYFLIITHTTADPSIAWLIFLTTEAWFKKEGIHLLHNNF